MPMKPDDLPDAATPVWRAWLAAGAPADAPARLYDVMRIGGTPVSADEGARLILAGTKTATSSLLAEYGTGSRPPEPGHLSILLDGAGRGVAIVETFEVVRRSFAEVDAGFARDYGEWDRTLATWQRECGAYYAALSRDLGVPWSPGTELICERFRVVFPPRPAAGVAIAPPGV